MDYRIHSDQWGFCLFSFNVYPDVLSYFKAPKSPEDQTHPEENLFQSLKRHIGESNLVCDFNLLGFHDLICIFKESPTRPEVEDQHNVIEKITEWSYQLTRLREYPPDIKNLRQATEQIWKKHLPDIPKLREHIRNIRSPTGNGFYKIPSLYNYTHDAFIPLYPAAIKLENDLKKLKIRHTGDSQSIIALSFLRIDPRVMAICDNEDPYTLSCWNAYHAVLQQLDTFLDDVVAVWVGQGTAQLIVLWSCKSISDLANIRTHMRNKTNVRVPGNDRHYNVVSSASTLIVFPKDLVTDDISFNILLRLWSGFHGQSIWNGLLDIAKDVGLDVEKIKIGDRQGLFDGEITIPVGMPYTAVHKFIQVLNCGCPFIEDVATFVGHEGKKWRTIVND